jgi:hypothetical protein
MLAESIPFPGRDGFQIAIAVARRGERPPIPPKAPAGLRTLMGQCWHAVPECRPTFAQVCLKLAQKHVFYPDGNADALDAFFERLPFSEDEVRDMSTPTPFWAAEFDRVLPAPEDFRLAQYAVKEGRASPVDVHNTPLGADEPSKEIMMPPPMPLPRGAVGPKGKPGAQPAGLQKAASRKKLAPLSVKPIQRNAPGFVPPFCSVAPTKPEANIFLKGLENRRPPKSEFNARAAGTTSLSDNPFLDKNDDSLAGSVRAAPRRSAFESFFMSKLTELTVETAQPFFSSLVEQINQTLSISQRANVLNQLSFLVASQPAFVPAFLGSKLIETINFKDPADFEAKIRILIGCFQSQPSSVPVEYLRELTPQANKREYAMFLLKFLSVFLPRAAEHPQSSLVVELFLTGYKCYLISEKFINMVYFIFKSPLFPSFRGPCLDVFRDGSLSTDQSIAKSCYAAFCQMEIAPRDIPTADFCRFITEGVLAVEGIEVLARLTSFPNSHRLVAAFLAVGSKSPLTVVCLGRMACDPEGAELIFKNRVWLNPAATTLSVAHAFRIFLAISQHAKLREGWPDCEETPPFLRWIAQEAEPHDLKALMVVLRRMRLTPDFILALNAYEFFPDFFRRTLESGFPAVQDAAILLVDKFARVVWVDGFAHFIAYLPAILNSEQLRQKGLVAAVVLALHPQSKQFLIDVEIVNVLREIKIDPSFEQYRESLFAFIVTQKEED